MSAYQVHADTIDLLVAAADRWRVTFPGSVGQQLHACTNRDEAGQLLTDENARSVNYRYAEDQTDDTPVYRYTPLDLDRAAGSIPVPVLVLASVRCLRYQSCETSDYGSTRAAEFLNHIEAEACRRLITIHDAPWGFTRSWAAERQAKAQELVPVRSTKCIW